MGSLAAQVPDLISFAPGHPDPSTFPWDAIREAAETLLRGRDANVLQYGGTRGYRPLLESLTNVLTSRGITSTLEERILTTGSQQALDLVGRVLLDPGDVVLVELPTYTGAITAFSNVQALLVGVPQDEDGVNLHALDETFQRQTSSGRRVKFLYVVPNFQNPTGLLISLQKRLALLEWAAQRDVLIVEDDPYRDLYFPDVTTEAETRPIAADDAPGRVIYLSSFSKTLAPGLRVGWVSAPPEIASRIELAKQAGDLCTGVLDQRVVYECCRRGILAAHLPELREIYQRKRTVMVDALTSHFGRDLSWPTPRGGFFLWAQLPGGLDAGRLLPIAQAHGVIYVAGTAFFVDGTGNAHIRLSFSAPSADRIREGVRRLASAVEHARLPSSP